MITFNKGIATKILLANRRKEHSFLGKFACLSKSAIRMHPEWEKIGDRKNIRNAFSHDADTILHSHFYARYIDKTQVFYLLENDNITRRVLHVQLVSKIGRVIGRSLRLNEDLIEAIALGHDIGHCPFGHNGENYLNELCEKHSIGLFLHNAQSIRNLMEIDRKGKGLNLTLQVLDGILSHNGEVLNNIYYPTHGKTFTDFWNEYNTCMSVAGYDKKLIPTTLEGCVVRISDIVAYVGRDIEDAITLKLIHRKNLPEKAIKVLGNTNSKIIDSLVTDILNNSFENEGLVFSQDVFDALRILKNYNYTEIYSHPKKIEQDEKIKAMFYYMFDYYLDQLENNDNSYIAKWAKNKVGKDYLGKTNTKRIVVDYIAGMTDDFLMKEYRAQLLPKSFGYNFES